ncbi:armadillo-type protein [Exophiala viscosa]|uniref:Armadillo-type protein n=1 Tax=Exophiala viscosa TaxID=2486360 RepID=A0AAN6DMZ2_9EURO|nr:armadillo-type protein [Exophiala viscosa]KAI1620858.1 armadillo-type protein [Exophiala viscosa]
MPSFSIEAEGETNPLTRQLVVSTLTNASQPAAHTLKVATQQIANWEKTPGYYALLQDIYADLSLGQDVRFHAIIQLKNGIDKYWRKTSTHAIGKDEKQQIRTKSIEAGVREPVSALALQNALMLAKIVRYEFPHDWPDVIHTIIQHLQAASQDPNAGLYTSNILTITLQIIKELASGRLQRTKKSLQQVSPELLRVLGSLYVDLVSRWQPLSVTSDLASTRNSYSALKTLRRLLVVGFESPHREDDVIQFWALLQSHQDSFWSACTQDGSADAKTMLMKHLLQLSKLYLDMARNHPASFVLLGCTDILNRSWSIVSQTDAKILQNNFDWGVYRDGDIDNESSGEAPIEKLSLKALLLFRACLKMVFNPVHTFRYQTPQDKEDRKNAVEFVKDSVLQDAFVMQLMEILVTQYFVLRPSDLREWEQEPDEWERREEEIADAWEFSIRSCSEKLFLDLVINFKELLVPRLLDVFHQYAVTSNTNVLLKDSLYSAVGIAAACLEDVLDFNTFLRTTLVPEVQMLQPNYNLLRRRTAILLGQWVPIKPEAIDRVAVYQIFTHLLASGEELNDHVVRVTAGRQLRLVLEPFEFNFAEFQPYASHLLKSLMSLISETELSETKMALLETVRVAVTKLEGHIEPYAPDIMSMLQPLWIDSGEEHLMKQAILTMVTAIVTSLGQKSLSYHVAILPIIRDSVQPDSEAIVYLLEEALDLWTAIIQQTPSDQASPELLTLSHSLLPLLDIGSELLRQIFEIVESYIMLSPTTILEPKFLTPLLGSMKELLSMLSSSRTRDASLAPHVLENLVATIAVGGHLDPQQGFTHLLGSMVNTGYLASLLALLKQAYDYHQDPRVNRRPPDLIGPGETTLFTLLARIALLSPDQFVQAVIATNVNSAPTPSPMHWLVTEWLQSIDGIGDVLRKKLQVLALTSLLTTTTSPCPDLMLDNLQSLLTTWTDVVLELGQDASDESKGDYLWHNTPGNMPEWPDATPEDGRKRVVSNGDPIYTVNIREFIASTLRLTMESAGGPAAFEHEWLTRVDSVVLKAFVDLKLL